MTSHLPASDFENVEAERLTVQDLLDSERTAEERNKWGQFATPPVLARAIVAEALAYLNRSEVQFLEPSCGSGSFWSALAETADDVAIVSAVGVELDPRFADAASRLWSGTGLEVVQADFLQWSRTQSDRFDLLIANPPYVRHHHFDAATKRKLTAEVEAEVGVQVSGLAGLYAYFLLLAGRCMAPDAVSAWLIPSEFADVNFGAALREYLTRHVQLLRVHRFAGEDGQFADALVSSSVVFFRHVQPVGSEMVRFTRGGSLAEPREDVKVRASSLPVRGKWTGVFTAGSTDKVEGNVRLGDLFQIRRGIATGANGFFILDRSEASKCGFRQEHLRPVLPSSRYLPVDIVEADDDGWPQLSPQKALISVDCSESELEESDPALAAYLAAAPEKVRAGYLVKQRSPWYRQEQRETPLFLCTYMGRGDSPFRFILNRSDAIATNSFLLLTPTDVLRGALEGGFVTVSELHTSLQEIGRDVLVDGGRSYGGGLQKLEPKELAELPIRFDASLLSMLPI